VSAYCSCKSHAATQHDSNDHLQPTATISQLGSWANRDLSLSPQYEPACPSQAARTKAMCAERNINMHNCAPCGCITLSRLDRLGHMLSVTTTNIPSL
jgi:hypothetical protein